MPTYGYRCKSCDREFDAWQRMTDEPVATCPTCGGSGKRLFFPAGLVFKGSGFYVTDSRRGVPGSNGSGSAASKSDASSGSGDSGKRDTTKPTSDSGSTSGSSTSAAPAKSND